MLAVLLAAVNVLPPLVLGALGLLFGALFTRHDLEAAMLAHAGFHLGLVPLGLVMAA